jgi:L-ascorbate metabolism protein UlaG (beta-lactamase superfamily)
MTNRSDHFDGERFHNLRNVGARPFSAVPKMLAERGEPWPASVPVTLRVPPPLEGEAAVVTFIGHATFLIQTAAGNFLTDPIYSSAAGPFGRLGPRRSRQPGVRFDDLPRIDTVLLSHNHYDHCDRPTLRALAKRFDPLVITPLGNGRIARAIGFRRIEEGDWWDRTDAAGLPITLTPAQHFSARTPFDRNRALWGGFMLQVGERRIYFAGDSGYGDHFRDIRRRLGAIDLALLPIGAYEPRWFMQPIHMNPAEAVQAHLDLESPRSIGMHFGTFRMTIEGIDAPVVALDDARRANGLSPSQFTTLDWGESIRVD